MVTLVWHPKHPCNGDIRVPIGTAELHHMVDPNTTIGKNWHAQMDEAADTLQKFKDAVVPVLFRPIHEQNGPFFWWGHDGSKGSALRDRQAAWMAVWRGLVHKLATEKGLNNVLFVFAANRVSWEGIMPPMTYYPGAAWVDAVGIDVYDNDLNLGGGYRGLRHYAALVGTGKPFGLTEIGQTTNEETGTGTHVWDARVLAMWVRDSYERTALAAAWYSSVQEGKTYRYALADAAFIKELLEDPLIETQ
jgi:mannan endo-1,4-beta-mannosidase